VKQLEKPTSGLWRLSWKVANFTWFDFQQSKFTILIFSFNSLWYHTSPNLWPATYHLSRVCQIRRRVCAYSLWSHRDWTAVTHLWSAYRGIHLTSYSMYKTRLIFQLRPRDNVMPSLIQLHWLPVRFRVQYELCILYRHWSRLGLFNKQVTSASSTHSGLRSVLQLTTSLGDWAHSSMSVPSRTMVQQLATHYQPTGVLKPAYQSSEDDLSEHDLKQTFSIENSNWCRRVAAGRTFSRVTSHESRVREILTQITNIHIYYVCRNWN